MAQLGSCISNSYCCVNDAVCCTISLEDTGEIPVTVWEDVTDFVINGTIMIENNGITDTSPTAALYVNGEAIGDFVLAPGECRSITLNDINSIGIVGAGTGSSNVKVSFSINYKF
ncbi:DUF3992 domain-containing protein [Halobacillus karajensis]|uniref:Endospore appendages core domain-containing protein n=1 Tax=Halobacillus karajensis TaxID=195088 RepID=A0A024P804_9BACI|nr:S-Ena type endospore appendage [Halobacillus karajensis]CDQ20264.1 hypothetical protein BN982_02587 [Halobacillus karajensis]CDQ25075.1 hypothetical protein BN983_03380 [Halobacillus karajensis]CDQ28564.1 hypothetical protein BN981_02872 [Halobacillus karajensis]